MTFENSAENRKKLADAFRASADMGEVLVESVVGLNIYQIADRIEQGIGIGKTVFEDAAAFIDSRGDDGSVDSFLQYLRGPQLALVN
jgi:hypothetical protein